MGRVPALAYHAFQATLLSHAQQRPAVSLSEPSEDGRATEALQKHPQARLAFHQRLRTEITK